MPPPTAPDDPVARWTDLSYIAAANEWEHAHHFFGGEAFPGWHGGYPGHASVPAFLGCPITLDHATGWASPVLNDDDWDITTLRIQKEGQLVGDSGGVTEDRGAGFGGEVHSQHRRLRRVRG